MDTNGRPCIDTASRFTFSALWKELRPSVLIAQTMEAELVNKVGAGRGQVLPRYIFYGYFTTETKHSHHWSGAETTKNEQRKTTVKEKNDNMSKKRETEVHLMEKHIKCFVWTKPWLPSFNTLQATLSTNPVLGSWTQVQIRFLNSVQARQQGPQISMSDNVKFADDDVSKTSTWKSIFFSPVASYMKPSDCFGAPEHGWPGWPVHSMGLEQFPFDLQLPLSCRFTLGAWHPPTLPTTSPQPSFATEFFTATTSTIDQNIKI